MTNKRLQTVSRPVKFNTWRTLHR